MEFTRFRSPLQISTPSALERSMPLYISGIFYSTTKFSAEVIYTSNASKKQAVISTKGNYKVLTTFFGKTQVYFHSAMNNPYAGKIDFFRSSHRIPNAKS